MADNDEMFGTGPDFWNPKPRFWAGVPWAGGAPPKFGASVPTATPTVPSQTQPAPTPAQPAQLPTQTQPTLGGLGAGQTVTPTAPQSEAERLRQQGPPQLSGWKKGLDIGANIGARVLGLGNLERGIVSSVPGSPENYQARLGQAQAQEKQELGRQKSQADLRNVQSEIDLRTAEAEKARREAPQKPENVDQTEADYISAEVAKGRPYIDVLKEVETAKAAGKPEPKESKAVAGTVNGTPTWGVQTPTGWTDVQGRPLQGFSPEKPAKEQPPQRMLGITPEGKVIEMVPGMQLPPGTRTLGGELNVEAKQGMDEQAGLAAQQYAKTYLASGKFTGPGDEALMEKFFELAKPEKGFRMTTAQQQMLLYAQNWFNQAKASTMHALFGGTYFSDEQRKQIVDTMSNLQKAREDVKPGARGGIATPPTAKSQWQNDGAGNYRYSNDGGKTWNNYGGRQ